MASMKVLVFLLGAMLLLMEFQRTSAASLFEDLDDDDVLEDGDDFDLDKNSDASKLDDLDDAVQEKRRACADFGTRRFCSRFRSYCRKGGIFGRLTKKKCMWTCGCMG